MVPPFPQHANTNHGKIHSMLPTSSIRAHLTNASLSLKQPDLAVPAAESTPYAELYSKEAAKEFTHLTDVRADTLKIYRYREKYTNNSAATEHPLGNRPSQCEVAQNILRHNVKSSPQE